MKIVVTGAHFTPAVAVIQAIKKMDKVEVVYVGRKTTLEGDNSPSVEQGVLTSLGVKFIPIITGRLQRSFTIYTIPSLLKIPIGLLQALYIILSEKPDLILSFGGYVAVPIVIISWLFSIPIIIHEQSLHMGLANKISSYLADAVAVSFADSFKGEKVILTGNPIRREIIETKAVKQAHRLLTVLIMGGNQGSHVINLATEGGLDKLLKIASVIHAAGDNKFADFERLGQLKRSGKLGKLGEKYLVKKWIGKEYGLVLQKVDLVVCRAGINTLTELAFLGKPALIIPIPNSEQQVNAKYFQALGLVKVLPQSELSGETLFKNIKFMLNNLHHLKEQAKETNKVVIPDAAKRLALETLLLAKKTDVQT